MKTQLLDLDPERYRPHRIHGEGNDWLETNCATDMWVEILHSLGLDPVAGLAFSVATDFAGGQWDMFTYPAEDLRCLYGIEVHELNVWRPLVDHVEEEITMGNLVSFDVDAYHLPDTKDLTYQAAHQKTTVCAQMIDREERRLGYFHNAGYAILEGVDFDDVFLLGEAADPVRLAMPPYTDQVRLGSIDPGAASLDAVVGRLRVHLSRRPVDNPVSRLTKRLRYDAEWLVGQDMSVFHRYAFGTFRHLGANGQLAAAFVQWLDRHDGGGLGDVSALFEEVSTGAKRIEFMLARVAAGRHAEIERAMEPLEEAWEKASQVLVNRYGY